MWSCSWPGTYNVTVSNPATWSQNGQSGGRGFVRILGSFVAPPQNPQPQQPNQGGARPSVQSFGTPMVNNYKVGQCFRGTGQNGNGSDCQGQTSADAFCRTQGFNYSGTFRTIQTLNPTIALGDRAICSVNPAQAAYSRCFTFEYVVCRR
jgi:hypothetical protein